MDKNKSACPVRVLLDPFQFWLETKKGELTRKCNGSRMSQPEIVRYLFFSTFSFRAELEIRFRGVRRIFYERFAAPHTLSFFRKWTRCKSTTSSLTFVRERALTPFLVKTLRPFTYSSMLSCYPSISVQRFSVRPVLVG